jgi:hypothetical protein
MRRNNAAQQHARNITRTAVWLHICTQPVRSGIRPTMLLLVLIVAGCVYRLSVQCHETIKSALCFGTVFHPASPPGTVSGVEQRKPAAAANRVALAGGS